MRGAKADVGCCERGAGVEDDAELAKVVELPPYVMPCRIRVALFMYFSPISPSLTTIL